MHGESVNLLIIVAFCSTYNQCRSRHRFILVIVSDFNGMHAIKADRLYVRGAACIAHASYVYVDCMLYYYIYLPQKCNDNSTKATK